MLEYTIPISCSKSFGHFNENHIIVKYPNCQQSMAKLFSSIDFYLYKRTVAFQNDGFLTYQHYIKNLSYWQLVVKQKSDSHQNMCKAATCKLSLLNFLITKLNPF